MDRMLADGVLAFARAALPAPPARVLEVGAGAGELAAELQSAGYHVTAIDPAAAEGTGVQRASLLDVGGTFDAAVAVVSLHHLEPLADSCAHLASLLLPGAVLVIDEFDVGRLDERAARWWLSQRRATGIDDDHEPATLIAFMTEHVHPLQLVLESLAPYFVLGEPVRGPYLHRWNLDPRLRDVEERLIAAGRLPATGARLVGRRG